MIRSLFFRLISLIFWIGAFSFITQPAFAADTPQPSASAEVIEKRIRKEAEEKLLAQKPPEPIPVQVEKKKTEQKEAVPFRVNKINLEGDLLLPPEELKPLVSLYEQRMVTFPELEGLSQKIEDLYRGKGFFVVVVIPPQRVADQTVKLNVIASRMGTLEFKGNRYFRSGRMRAYWKIPEGQVLTYKSIRKSVAAMNENPDRYVQPLLRAGAKAGTTDVTLRVKDRFPLHAGYSFDNQGARLTGKRRHGFTLRNTNLLTLDDTFLIGTAFGKDFGALFLNHLIPITAGARFVWNFSHAQVNPLKEFAELGINGISQTYGLSLRQWLYKSDRITVDSFLGFDFKEKRTRTQSVTTVWDRLRVLNFGGVLQAMDSSGVWSLGQNFYLGFSPHGNGYALTSRDANTHFFKYGFSVERQQKLMWGTTGIVHFEGQLSPHKLVPQEELFMGGAGSVRGYPESDYGADQGIVTNIEYRIPAYMFPADWQLPRMKEPLRKQVQMIAFMDHGYGQVRGPSPSEKRSHNLLGVGGGLLIHLWRNISARTEWASAVGSDTLTEGGRSQFHFRIQTEV